MKSHWRSGLISPSRSVHGAPTIVSISAATAAASSERRRGVPRMRDRLEAQPGAERRRLPRELRNAVQPAVVDDLRDESADVGMHPPRAFEKESHVRRHRSASSPSRCSSTDAPVPSRMRPLRNLRELQRVAEQHDVARGRSHRERVGKRHLSGFVDDERVDGAVERLSAKSHAVPAKSSVSAPAPRECLGVVRAGDGVAVVSRLGVVARRLLQSAKAQSFFPRGASPPRRADCGSPCGSSRSRRRAARAASAR